VFVCSQLCVFRRVCLGLFSTPFVSLFYLFPWSFFECVFLPTNERLRPLAARRHYLLRAQICVCVCVCSHMCACVLYVCVCGGVCVCCQVFVCMCAHLCVCVWSGICVYVCSAMRACVCSSMRY